MLEEPLFFLLSTDFPDLTETETTARTTPMRSQKSVKSVKSVDKKQIIDARRALLFFIVY